ncbi:MAG: cell division protein SepF [Frankia sp.]|nr:cell division protein SepF [Frankia sp.]
MAGVLRKTMVYLGLVEQGDEDDGYDDDLLDLDEDERLSVRALGRDEPRAARYAAVTPRPQGSLAVDTARVPRLREEPSVAAAPDSPSYRITTFVPVSYNDAKGIGEHFRDGVPVIMNLSEMDDRNAMRLIDFAAGLTFGLRGRLEKVTNKVFLLSPSNVEVSAEDKARIREGGFFNQS